MLNGSENREYYFTNLGLNDIDLEYLIPAITNAKNIKILDISSNPFNISHLLILIEIIKEKRNVAYLNSMAVYTGSIPHL